MRPNPDKTNRLARANNRLQEVNEELLKIIADRTPEKTIIMEDGEAREFDNAEWINAEGKALVDEANNLQQVANLEGTVDYDG